MSLAKINDLFISYRQEDKQFVKKLFSSFKASGLSLWNEENAISPGTTTNNRTVERGIMLSNSFVFVMSPNSLVSELCLFEIVTASKFHKPIVVVVATKPTEDQELTFVPEVLDHCKWFYFENSIFADKYSELLTEIQHNQEGKKQHSQFLTWSNQWEQSDKKNTLLLSGNRLQKAEKWLANANHGSASYSPTYTEADYICESRKFLEAGQTDVFFSYVHSDEKRISRIRKHITELGYTSWSKRSEIKTVCRFTHSIEDLVLQSDSVIFFMSEKSVVSDRCALELKLAQAYKKKIIFVKLDPLALHEYPLGAKKHSIIDLTVPKEGNSQYQLKQGLRSLNTLLKSNYAEHKLHKELLLRSKIWNSLPDHTSLTLKGFQLIRAEKWLHTIEESKCCALTPEIEKLIAYSAEQGANKEFDAFFAYAEEDYLFAKRIREELQLSGYNVWFDPIELKDKTEIDPLTQQAIINSNQVIFLISPESLSALHVKKELKWALAWNKQIIPVQIEDVNLSNLPRELSIFPILEGRIAKALLPRVIDKIVRQLQVKQTEATLHTRWLKKSIEWTEAGKANDKLLQAEQVHEATHWLSEKISSMSEPFPVQQQIDYITQSQKAVHAKAQKKQYFLWIIAALFVFAATMAGIFKWNETNAISNYHVVGTKLRSYQAESTLEKDPTLSLRLAEAGYDFNPNSPHTFRGLLKSYLSDYPLYNKLFESQKEVNSVQFSTGAKQVLLATNENKVYIISTEGKIQHSFSHGDIVYSAKYSTDGKYLITVGKDELKIWSAKGDQLGSISFDGGIFDADISPDNKYIAIVGSSKVIKLHNFSGNYIRSISAHYDDINEVSFSPTGKRILSLSHDGTAALWNLSGKLIKRFLFEDTPMHVEFSNNDSTLLVAGSKKTTGVYSDRGNKIVELKTELSSTYITEKGNNYFTANSNNVICMWNSKGKLIKDFRGHTATVRSIDIDLETERLVSASGKYASDDNSVRIWNMKSRNASTRFKRNAISAIAYSPSGKFFAISYGRDVEVFGSDGLSHKTFKAKYPVTDLTFLTGGNSIYVAHQNNIISQYTRKGEFVKDIETPHTHVTSLDISPDGVYMISSGADNVIALWNLNELTETPIVAHRLAVSQVQFSADSERFITASEDSTAKVWNTDGELLFSLNKHKAPVLWGSFSPDNKYIITTGLDNKAVLWSEDGEYIREINEHNEAVTSASFSKDSRFLLTTSYDKTSRLWSLSGELLYTFAGKGTFEQFNEGIFSPDGSHLLLNSRDISNAGIVSIYNISPQELIENINQNKLFGHIWQLDQRTKKIYNILE